MKSFGSGWEWRIKTLAQPCFLWAYLCNSRPFHAGFHPRRHVYCCLTHLENIQPLPVINASSPIHWDPMYLAVLFRSVATSFIFGLRHPMIVSCGRPWFHGKPSTMPTSVHPGYFLTNLQPWSNHAHGCYMYLVATLSPSDNPWILLLLCICIHRIAVCVCVCVCACAMNYMYGSVIELETLYTCTCSSVFYLADTVISAWWVCLPISCMWLTN